MESWLALSGVVAVAAGWAALGWLVLERAGRFLGRRGGRRARRVAEGVTSALAWSPVAAAAAVASLVVRARVVDGAWPGLGERPLDVSPLAWCDPRFRATDLPVHRTLVVVVAAVAWTLPLLLPSALGLRHGLGLQPCLARGALAVGGWLGWVMLHVADPGGFLAWTFVGVLCD